MTITWTNERRKLKDLTPWPNNPRHIDDDSAERLDNSLQKFGEVDTISVEPSGMIVNGHQRYRRLLLSRDHESEIEVRVANRPLSEAERKELTIYLHESATGDWQPEMMPELYEKKELEEWGMTADKIAAMSWNGEEERGDTAPQADRAKELQEKWGTSLGQIWQLDKHRLIIGDCTDSAVVEALMMGETADTLFTDPPFGYDKGIAGDESLEIALAQTQAAINAIDPHISPSAWGIVDTPKKYIIEYISLFKSLRWIPAEPVLTMYRNSMLNGRYGTNIFELSMVYTRGNGKKVNRNVNGVDIIKVAGGERNAHPLQKYTKAYQHFLGMFSKEREKVLDPFVGSGTTIIAAHNLNRTAYTCEIEPKFAAVCLQRFLDHTQIEPTLTT